jgi:hypothetical protein
MLVSRIRGKSKSGCVRSSAKGLRSYDMEAFIADIDKMKIKKSDKIN